MISLSLQAGGKMENRYFYGLTPGLHDTFRMEFKVGQTDYVTR